MFQWIKRVWTIIRLEFWYNVCHEHGCSTTDGCFLCNSAARAKRRARQARKDEQNNERLRRGHDLYNQLNQLRK